MPENDNNDVLVEAPEGTFDTTATMSDPVDSEVFDPALDTTDAADAPDVDTQAQTDALNDAQQTELQAQQAEANAAASGDYATAQDQAHQAYSASQDVANAGGLDNTSQTWTAAQDESWANWDQQTADQNAQAAASYEASGNPDDAAIYAAAADNAQGNADNFGEAGEYGDPLGPSVDSPAVAEDTVVDEAPAVDDSAAAVEDTAPAVEETAVDDDSSAA